MLALFGGADVFSVTIIVAAFMGGLGFGNLAGGSLADRLGGRRRLLLFAACEAAVALFALASAWIYYDLLYVRVGAHAFTRPAMAAIVFVVTLWPTFFMGMSLPIAAKVLTVDTRQPARWVPLLYGVNTLGAAAGSFLSIGLLFPLFSFRAIVLIGAAISGVCALVAVQLWSALGAIGPSPTWSNGPSSPGRGLPPTETTAPAASAARSFGWTTWLAIYALSGFVALSLEILWFRVLGVLLKSNAYTFGHLLGIFLAGVALGALAGTTRWARRLPAMGGFLALQAAIPIYAALSIAAFATMVNRVDLLDPVWQYLAQYEPLSRLNLSSPLYLIVHGLIPAAFILPPTFMMGLSFGCLQRAVQNDVALLGRRVGWLQTANIAGSMIGALVTGLWLLDRIGSAGTFRVLLLSSCLFAALSWRVAAGAGARRRAALALAVAIASMLAVPANAVLWARLHAGDVADVWSAEDGSGLAALKPRRNDTQVVLYANGIGQSWLPFGGTHTALGALPAFIHPSPARVAVIGLGSGDTAFAIGGRAETATIDSIEIIEPEIRVLEAYPHRARFPALGQLLAEPRISHHFTDGRTLLRHSPDRYDIIEADALRPTSAYSGNLYSVEYFELLRDRLAPGGLAVTWTPTPRVRDTFVSVFPFVLIFNDLALGSMTPIAFDERDVRSRLSAAFSVDYYGRGRVDIAAVLAPYLAAPPLRFDPSTPRTGGGDLNHDLFPRDEFGVARRR